MNRIDIDRNQDMSEAKRVDGSKLQQEVLKEFVTSLLMDQKGTLKEIVMRSLMDQKLNNQNVSERSKSETR